MEERSSAKGFIIGVVAGGVIGGLTALLYAPKSGRELRGDISRKSKELVSDAEEYADQARKKTAGIISDSRKKAEEILSEARSKAQSIGRGAEKLYTQGKDIVSEETAKLKDALKAGVDSYKEERKQVRH